MAPDRICDICRKSLIDHHTADFIACLNSEIDYLTYVKNELKKINKEGTLRAVVKCMDILELRE